MMDTVASRLVVVGFRWHYDSGDIWPCCGRLCQSLLCTTLWGRALNPWRGGVLIQRLRQHIKLSCGIMLSMHYHWWCLVLVLHLSLHTIHKSSLQSIRDIRWLTIHLQQQWKRDCWELRLLKRSQPFSLLSWRQRSSILRDEPSSLEPIWHSK